MTENISPSPQPSPSEGRGSKKRIIYPSTYINPKKRRFRRVVCKKIKKYLSLYLVNAKKRSFYKVVGKKIDKKLNLFFLLIIGLDSRLRGNDREEVKMIKKGSGNSSTIRKKIPP